MLLRGKTPLVATNGVLGIWLHCWEVLTSAKPLRSPSKPDGRGVRLRHRVESRSWSISSHHRWQGHWIGIAGLNRAYFSKTQVEEQFGHTEFWVPIGLPCCDVQRVVRWVSVDSSENTWLNIQVWDHYVTVEAMGQGHPMKRRKGEE